MNDSASHDKQRVRIHNQLVLDFVSEVREQLEGIHKNTLELEAFEAAAWERTLTVAHNIGARAQALRLGVLASCAREFENFAGLMLTGDVQSRRSAFQSAMVALETISLEIQSLSKGLDEP